MANNKETSQEAEKIKLVVHFTPELYTKFQQSSFRRLANTDSEGIRSCVLFSLNSKQSTQLNNESQEKSLDEVRP
jgi:hypothetical protein